MNSKKPHVHDKLFSDIHSCIEKEWLGKEIIILDDAGVLAAKSRLDDSYESVMNLVSVLCFQLRYKESLEICEKLFGKFPDDYALQRRLGVLYFKLLKFDDSEKFLDKCLKHTDEELQILYILAVVSYYKGNYVGAKRLFERCAPLCEDDGEMFVAVLYWYVCCLEKLRLSRDEFVAMSKKYNNRCGHHTGYDVVVRFALNLCSEEEAASACERDTALNRCCAYYGLSVLTKRNDGVKSLTYLRQSLISKDLFGAYSYIAGYVDLNNNL